MPLCKVNSCRFATKHSTKSHTCGKCGQAGHGQIECGNAYLIAELAKDTEDVPFDLHCVASKCVQRTNHTIDGHFCTYCKIFGHDHSECPTCLWDVKVERVTTFGMSKENFLEKKKLQLVAKKQLGWSEHKAFTKIYAEMGCTWYCRRDNTFEKIELFFMHSDNWGQYGPETDDRPKLDAFLKDYKCVDKE